MYKDWELRRIYRFLNELTILKKVRELDSRKELGVHILTRSLPLRFTHQKQQRVAYLTRHCAHKFYSRQLIHQ